MQSSSKQPRENWAPTRHAKHIIGDFTADIGVPADNVREALLLDFPLEGAREIVLIPKAVAVAQRQKLLL